MWESATSRSFGLLFRWVIVDGVEGIDSHNTYPYMPLLHILHVVVNLTIFVSSLTYPLSCLRLQSFNDWIIKQPVLILKVIQMYEYIFITNNYQSSSLINNWTLIVYSLTKSNNICYNTKLLSEANEYQRINLIKH